MPGIIGEIVNKPATITDDMVSRFLACPLPDDFAPDCYIDFTPVLGGPWPTVTNLLHAGQARAMLEHVLGALPDQAVIHLTPHEVQSGSTRVDWAEGLIRQLPETHDGRNSWLLNYGSGVAGRQKSWAERNPNSPLAKAINAPELRPTATATPVAPVEAVQNKQPSDQFEADIEASLETMIGIEKYIAAPRVTQSDVDAAIVETYFFTAADGANEAGYRIENDHQRHTARNSSLAMVTFCLLVLKNGTKVVGINYGAIDPAQHSPALGRIDARADAIRQIWPLMGYALRERLAQGGAA